jgi:hypothetical protein
MDALGNAIAGHCAVLLDYHHNSPWILAEKNNGLQHKAGIQCIHSGGHPSTFVELSGNNSLVIA